MKWIIAEPKPGDIIRIEIRTIFHYGIYISDNEVIQFGMPPIDKKDLVNKDIKVISTDINTFTQGNFLEVNKLSFKEKLMANKVSKIIKIARSRLGESGYNIVSNNCEHFVYECVFNVHKSIQVEK